MGELFTIDYDEKFRKIGIVKYDNAEIGEYNRYPQMMPWVGAKYDEGGHKKILLIGESHYLPDCAEERFRTTGGWYYQDEEELVGESEAWTNTRKIVGMGPTTWTNEHGLYREINKVIGSLTNQNPETENLFQYVAFYNYFLRPAHSKGLPFEYVCEEIDLNVARDAFLRITEIIQPDYVYFFSKYAWDCLHKDALNDVIMNHFPPPSCHWWNRQMTGKEKFTLFLKDNQIF